MGLSNKENIKKVIMNITITTVEIEQNCFAVAVLAVMKMFNKSQEGNIFLANQKKFSNLFANELDKIWQISQDIDKEGNECQNFETFHELYLKLKGFDLCVFND